MLGIAEEVGRDFFCFGNGAIFQLEELSSIIAVLVCLSTADELGEEREAGLFL